MGIQQALIAAGLASPVSIPGGTLHPASPGQAAEVAFLADGQIRRSGAANVNWYTPTTTDIGVGYYLRRTITGDALADEWGAGWRALSQERAFVTVTTNCSSSIFFEIATNASDSDIVASGTYVLTVP